MILKKVGSECGSFFPCADRVRGSHEGTGRRNGRKLRPASGAAGPGRQRADGRHAADQNRDHGDANARHHARKVGRDHAQEHRRRGADAARQTAHHRRGPPVAWRPRSRRRGARRPHPPSGTALAPSALLLLPTVFCFRFLSPIHNLRIYCCVF